MTSGNFRFDRFCLDPHDRLLTCDGVPVEVNARYLDALALLVREQGRLVSKDRFLDEVWHGVPVTDEALTQCIRTLRRQLGDSATQPRFIETVVKHGYRFIAPVERVESPETVAATVAGEMTPPVPPVAVAAASASPWPLFFRIGGAGTIGAGLAGLMGGLLYGFAASSPAPDAGVGAASVLLVVICLTVAMAVLGGAGVSFGIAAAGLMPGHRPGALGNLVGGAVGGLLVGAVVKLLGIDAFNLLFGQSPGNITGGPEGALLGAAVGLGIWLGQRLAGPRSFRRAVAVAGLCGGLAGAAMALLGGHLMAGSLVQLGDRFASSRLHVDQIGALFGESGFGLLSQVATAGLEGALFSACVAGAMLLARGGVEEI